MVLYGYLAAVTSMELVTGIIILPQRQTVLAAMQAAGVDLLTGGKFRLGVGIGWNRGAGLAPMPVQRPIPVWIGAQSSRAYRRAGRLADGWFPQMAPGPQLGQARRIVAEAAAQAGRDPASLGMEGRLRWQQDRDTLATVMRQWQDAGATHLSVNTMGAGLVAVLNRARPLRRRLAAFPALLSLLMPRTGGRCGSPARRAIGPRRPPRPAMRPTPGVQPRLIMGACRSSDWTVPSM